MQKIDLALSETATAADLLIGCEHNIRLEWVQHELGPDYLYLLQDGTLLRLMANEAIRCFVCGHFIASVLVAFSLIERSIAGRLIAAGEAGVREERDFEKLLDHANQKKWIAKQESKHIKEVCRKYRNSLAHIRTQTEPERHEIRANDTGRQLYEVIENDARIVLRSALDILRSTAI